VNEFGAEIIFKRRDLFADGRLPNATFLGHSGETPFFNDPDEHLHCIKFVHSSPPYSSMEWMLWEEKTILPLIV
jgi:hypothetical protein